MRQLAPGLACVAALAAARPAAALVVKPPPPLAERVALADCIVVGKLIGLERKEVVALPYRTARRKVAYRVAVLKVADAIKGAAGQKTLRVGFTAPPPRVEGDSIRPVGPRLGPVFTVGQNGLFFLKRHFKENLFTAPMYWGFLARKNLNFRQEVALTRFAVRHGKNLVAELEARDPAERFNAAALLLQRYRTTQGVAGKTELIGARESRLILAALATADWNQPSQVSPWNLFNQLGLTAKDGWAYPAGARTREDYHRAARAWLKKHGRGYRIRRIASLVPAEAPREK
jgi:hypothetical protein